MSDRVNPTLQEISAEALPERYDVAILGGGMAGLTLALQLKKARPATSIVVIERQKYPVPESAYKVGESTVEISAYYLRDVLGLQEHLQTQQIRKFGLRMFFSFDGNQDITRRVEYGQTEHAPLPAYQLDRGRFENALAGELPCRGMTLLDGGKVQQVSLQPQEEYHCLRVLYENNEREIQARWVVDATGRSSVLKRQLGLAKEVGHHANAAWFRINHPIDVDDWSTDPAWRARIEAGQRRLSTNHLMGPGYWVWLIPLASGSTSIGIVADASMHPFEEFNRLERALTWLRHHEPQCAEAVEPNRAKIQDFRVMKDYAYSCEQVYSRDRWCLTGEAAVAIDPLYSSGGDLIAIGNGLICDLVTRDLDGEDIEDRAAGHNQLFLIFADVWLVAYEQQYPIMGNAKVMVAKIIWDTIIYWAFPGLLYFHDKLSHLSESPSAAMNLYRCWNVHSRIQAFFREWHAIDQQDASDTFANPYTLLDFLLDLHSGMAAGLPDDELEVQFARNTRLLEQVAGQLMSTVIESCADRFDDERVFKQFQSWKADLFIGELIDIYRQEDRINPIDSSWITSGQQSPERQEVAK